MIEKQREKEFLFELERLYYNYYLVVAGRDDGEMELVDVDKGDVDRTSKAIELAIDYLRLETLEDVR